MRLNIRHVTTYDYDGPVPYGLLQLRMTPRDSQNQRVLSWDSTVEGGRLQLQFDDQHGNGVALLAFDPGTTQLSIISTGVVEVTDAAGVVGPHQGFVPLWLYQHATPRTAIGPRVRALVSGLGRGRPPLDALHALMAAVGETVAYKTGQTDARTTAEEALAIGQGVCQDHAHVFIAAARHMGHPARYVSGYLSTEDGSATEAAHAWAEVYLPDLGWLGFDPANGICPDARYVRVATGLDYAEAAPVSGTRHGPAQEHLSVNVVVQQQ
ncbi:putative transglutaminase protein [Ketogulonicigenium robustum]|uniref:Putative transglutaminase protein n=1 Tax=Ketogulonicigenium robustum TaxID=92947 RepID=A0A1W6NZU1_9RHOB|nr:transglutaminase family protein [Ketogulonicigenium robustum]ARO14782.1 putative transglutaminase protein [Ketogulonicigenium robustum]